MPHYNIFLVDDDVDDQFLFLEALKSLPIQFAFQTARDGIYALEAMKEDTFQRPDIIFLDLNMPRMNGLELLKAIRSQRQYHTIPVIMYSTSSAPEDINDCLSIGATSYMIKHSSFLQLCHDLHQTLKQHISFSSRS